MLKEVTHRLATVCDDHFNVLHLTDIIIILAWTSSFSSSLIIMLFGRIILIILLHLRDIIIISLDEM